MPALPTRLTHLALLAFLVLMPWVFPLLSPRGGHDGARMLQVGLQALMALVMLGGGPGGAALRGLLARPLIWALLAAAGWACLRAPQPLWAWREAAQWLGMGLVALWVADLARADSPWRRALAWSLIAGPLLQFAIELSLCLAGQLGGVAPGAGLIGLGYDNMRFFNHVQTVALPLLLLAPAWLPGSRAAPRLAGLAGAGHLALLWASGGRATMLALPVAAALVLWLSPGRRARPLRALLGAVALGAVLYGLVWVALPAVLGLVSPDSVGQRLAEGVGASSRDILWREAWQAWLGSPWWGIGPMHLAMQPNRLAMHPHQIYLQWLAEWGVVVTGLLLWALGDRLWHGLRAWRRSAVPNDDAALAAWLAVLAVLIDAAFSGNFVMPMSQLWIGVAWGLWLGTAAPVPPPAPPGPVRRAGASGLAVLLLAGQALAVVPAWREWGHLDALLRTALSEQIGTRMQPRFWSHGRLVTDTRDDRAAP